MDQQKRNAKIISKFLDLKISCALKKNFDSERYSKRSPEVRGE